MQTNCGIYCYTHRENGKIYIGSSIRLRQRHISHDRFPKEPSKWQYGYYTKDQFHYVIIEYHNEDISLKKLQKIEHMWIRMIPATLSLNTKKNFDVSKRHIKPKKYKRNH